MKMRALKFIPSAGSVKTLQSEIEADSRALVRLKSQDTPGAYVVTGRDLEALRSFKDVTVDRKEKNKAKQLSKLLLGHSRIPLVMGSYTASGRLTQGIASLLEQAKIKNDCNIYIIGVTDRLFSKLWQKTVVTPGTTRPSSRPRSGIFSLKPKPFFDGVPSSQLLLKLLPHREIPQDFLQTFVGTSAEVQLVRQLVMRAATSDDPVLVLGDTGTGKEVIARSIHKYSARASEKFVPVNCGAIPSELLESELFGHKRYAFTDAKFDKKGLWEITGNGTLFLDEIGDLALIHQVKLLRALEENKIRPIGEPKEIKVSARVIAATNRDLFSMVKTGQFREDLYYRLRAFLIRTPVLRDHPEDVPTLARFFWKRIARDERAAMPDDILAELQSYSWPGNARELKAVLMNLHVLFGKDDLDAARLKAVFQIQGPAPAETPESAAQREIITHRVDCLRHLRRVDEVLRACTVSARPLVESGQTDLATSASVRGSLRARLGELEQLCLNPLLFHGKVAFDVVDGLKEKLSYFYGVLEGDGKVALAYWKNEVTRELKLALTAIFQESERLEVNV